MDTLFIFAETRPPAEDSLPLPPRRRGRKTNLRKTCISLTKQIMDKIYLIDDQESLENLSEKLNDLLIELTPLTTNEDGMPVHVNTKRVRLSTANPKQLPQGSTGRPKSRFTGRVGQHAERMRDAHKVNIL